jgi:hypothetical protein
MIKAFTVSVLSLFFSSVQIASINGNTEGYLKKSGTFEINSGHLYKKGACLWKHGTNGNPNLVASVLCCVHSENGALFACRVDLCAVDMGVKFINLRKETAGAVPSEN